jgi:hypothetical protein
MKSLALSIPFLLVGCGDLALQPDRVPTSLSVAPADTLLTEGDQARLRVTVLDQDGHPFASVPSWAPPRWTVSEAGAVDIGPDGTLLATGGGQIEVRAALAGLEARTSLRINPSVVALTAPAVYLIQSAQNMAGDVPMVAGRKALLRVFVTGDRISFFQPRVRATFFQDGAEVHTAWMLPSSDLIPSLVDESRLDRSFNAVIPGTVLQPGVEMVVNLDPDGVVPLAPASTVRIPAEGRRALDVRPLPPLDLTMVPVVLDAAPNIQVHNWTGGMDENSSGLQLARAVLPIGELNVKVHETFTSSVDLTTDAGWSAFLREIRLLRAAEGDVGYYYGAVVLPPNSKWGGLGYIGFPASVGAASASTFAHELGHNLNLRHAPCGSVTSWDGDFPHAGGSTGVWGYDFLGGSGLGALVDPGEYKDLMGYCSPRWVSDYHFKRALDHRVATAAEARSAASLAPVGSGRVLLLWGSAGAGDMLLEPAFVLAAPLAPPSGEGPYRVDGRSREGRTLFSVSFSPAEDEIGGRSFAFSVPFDDAWEGVLDRITLSGPEGTVFVDRSGPTAVGLLRDRDSGRLRGVIRDGRAGPDPLPAGLEVLMSRGVPVAAIQGGGS